MVEPWIDAEWIRDRLHATGKTQRALSLALELDPSAVSRLLDGSRQLKAHEIPRVVDFFEGAPSHQRSVASAKQSASVGKSQLTKKDPGFDQPEQLRAKPGPRPKLKAAAELPVRGPLFADGKGFYSLEWKVAEWRPSPPQLLGVSGAYALFIPDDQLGPRYRTGEVVYIHPSRPPTTGSFVVVRFRSPEGRVAIGEVTFADAQSVSLRIDMGAERRSRSGALVGNLTINTADIGQIGLIVVTSIE